MDALKPCSPPSDARDEVELLLETLKKESAQRRESTRGLKLVLAAAVALLIVNVVSDIAKGKPFDLTSLLIFSSFFGCGCAYGLTPGLRQAVTRAASQQDKRLLGGMIEAMDSGEPQLKQQLETASTDLLEQVTTEDDELLDEYQLDQLLRAARRSTNRRFSKAAILALGRIGSKRTLQDLEILLNDPSLPQYRRYELEPHIRAAMADLRLRIAGELVSQAELGILSRPTVVQTLASHAKSHLAAWFLPQGQRAEAGSKQKP